MKGSQNQKYFDGNTQIGRLAIVPGSHARGKTLRIFVLPDGVRASWNGRNNAPLNVDAVEVYGVISGNPGWSESYGWLHHGPWVADFEAIVEELKKIIADRDAYNSAQEQRALEDRKQRDLALLSNYN